MSSPSIIEITGHSSHGRRVLPLMMIYWLVCICQALLQPIVIGKDNIVSLFFFFVVSIIKIRPARFIQQTYTRNVKCAFPNYVLAICSCLPSCHHPVWCVLSGWKSLTQSATLKPQDSKPSDWRAVRELTGTGFDRSHMHINLDGKTCTFLWLTVQARSGDDRGGLRALLGCLGSLLPYFGNDFLIFHCGITPSPLATHTLYVDT